MSTPRERAGQVLWIGFEADTLTRPLEDLLREIRPGGAVFFQRNIAAPDQFRALVGQLANLLSEFAPPFLAVDLEGGKVDRFRELLAPLPCVRDAARAGLARELGRIAGREVAFFSLNVNFAPVLDVASPESAPVLGSRTAGESPQGVADFGREFLAGLAQSGVLGCGKHFPGLGSGCLDSHFAMPRIEKSSAQLWDHDLFPFRALVSSLPMVMVAHAAYPALEGDAPSGTLLPASLSRRIVSSLLKQDIGFGGLVISDDLEMGGALEGRTIGEAAVAAIEAGCDMLLVCRQTDHVRAAFEAIVRRCERDTAFSAAVERASNKINQARRQLPRAPTFGDQSSRDALRAEILGLAEEIDRRVSEDNGKGIGA